MTRIGAEEYLVLLGVDLGEWGGKDEGVGSLGAGADLELVECGVPLVGGERPTAIDFDGTDVLHPEVLDGAGLLGAQHGIAVGLGLVVLDEQVGGDGADLDVGHGAQLAGDLDPGRREGGVEVHVQVVGLAEGQGGIDFLG